jgi:hypothetical protein
MEDGEARRLEVVKNFPFESIQIHVQ